PAGERMTLAGISLPEPPPPPTLPEPPDRKPAPVPAISPDLARLPLFAAVRAGDGRNGNARSQEAELEPVDFSRLQQGRLF
ncbi:MAG: hypothetical protein QN194_16435, partial [Armatimonadota bacterium]|nr:hypothetical protein [Armatimonadota bacterium]